MVRLSVVAFGTSAAEVAVSIGAALDGRTDSAVGNVVGSNIFNVLSILGVSALITPLMIETQIIRQEIPIMIGASLLLIALGLDGSLGLIDCVLLLIVLVVYTAFLVLQSRRNAASAAPVTAATPPRTCHWLAQAALIGFGLALLILGLHWLVGAAITTAKTLGVSDLVIGLTIVAAGTSMPEVATMITAALRGQRDIAVGNVIGSNTFNILGCLGLTGLVSANDLLIAPSLLNFELWVILATVFACLPICLSGCEIAHWEGALFLGYHVAYATHLILAAQAHDALQTMSLVMQVFVPPIIIATLFVVARRQSPPQAPR